MDESLRKYNITQNDIIIFKENIKKLDNIQKEIDRYKNSNSLSEQLLHTHVMYDITDISKYLYNIRTEIDINSKYAIDCNVLEFRKIIVKLNKITNDLQNYILEHNDGCVRKCNVELKYILEHIN